MVVPVSLKSFYQYITRPGRLSLPHPKSGLSRVLAPTQPQVDAFSSGTSFEASGRWTRDKRRLHELRSHPKLPECRFAEAFLQWQCCEIQIYAHLSYQHYHSYSLFIIHLLWMQPWRFWESYRQKNCISRWRLTLPCRLMDCKKDFNGIILADAPLTVSSVKLSRTSGNEYLK